jgi:hypothetical protein
MKDAVKKNQNELLNKNNDKLHFTYFAAMEKKIFTVKIIQKGEKKER